MDFFKDKVVFLTGGAAGVGLALCKELCRCGAKVTATDIDGGAMLEAAASIAGTGGRIRAERLDVTDAERFRELVEQVAAGEGRLDYLFNNAGVFLQREVRDMRLDDWRRLVEVNVMGVVHGTHAAYPLMVRQGSGHIVNIASIAGLVGFPTATAYAMTKHGVVGLSIALRAEAQDLGVRVTVVCPGGVTTGMGAAGAGDAPRRSRDGGAPRSAHAFDQGQVAPAILRGVERNEMFVVFPPFARRWWWLFRLWPALLVSGSRQRIRAFRRTRDVAP